MLAVAVAQIEVDTGNGIGVVEYADEREAAEAYVDQVAQFEFTGVPYYIAIMFFGDKHDAGELIAQAQERLEAEQAQLDAGLGGVWELLTPN